MKSKVCFLGVPTGFSTYPYPDKDGYYGQFYDTSHKQPWQLLIRQNKNIVRYIYIQYDLVSGASKTEPGRPGSLCGFSIELEGYYLNCTVKTLLPFFHKFYQGIVDKGILLKKEQRVHFQVRGFNQVSAYLNDRIAALKKIPHRLTNNLVKLETNLDVYAPPQITQFGSQHVNDETLNAVFLKSGWINIVPELPSQISPKTPTYISPTKKEKLNIENERLRAENEKLKQKQKQKQSQASNQHNNTSGRKKKAPIKIITGTIVLLLLLGVAGHGTGVFKDFGIWADNDSTRQNSNAPTDTQENHSQPAPPPTQTDCNQLQLVQEAKELRKKDSYSDAIKNLEKAKQQNPKCKKKIADLISEYKTAREGHVKETILDYVNNKPYNKNKTDTYVEWSRRIEWFKADILLGNHLFYSQCHEDKEYRKIKCGYYLKITYPEKAKDCE